MPAVSNLYQVQQHIDDYSDIAYAWNDSTHPETYQSFVTTGEGLIDQSIFCFARQHNAWSLGSYISQRYYSGNSNHVPNIMLTENNLHKNLVMVTNYITPGRNYLYSSNVINGCKYSPVSTQNRNIHPYINFPYSKFIIIPKFEVMINDGTEQYRSNLTYNDVINNGCENWGVFSVTLEYYLTGSSTSYTGINPLVTQFAGKIYSEEWIPLGGNDYRLGIATDPDIGVYYIEHNNTLFEGYQEISNGSTEHGQIGQATSYFDLTQMNTIVVPIWNSWYTCISLQDAYKMICNLGFYWGKDLDVVNSELGINCTDPDVVCAVIDPNTHIVTDTVLTGTDIADYALEHINDPFCNFLLDYGNTDEQDNPIGITTDEYRENFNPEQPTIEETETIDLYPPTIATTGGNTIWLLSEDEVKLFFNYLWDPTGSEVENILHGLALLGENPMDFIVSLRMFPIKNIYTLTTHSLATICFGRYTSQLTNKAYLTSSNVIILDLGEFYFNDGGLQNDFRDYEPYTRYSLYIPFCGITALNAIECINQTIDVKMIVDLSTGACTAVVYTNGVPYKYIDSTIGIEIPVVGRDMAGYAQTVMAAALGGGIGGKKIGETPVKGQLERKNLAKDYQQISYDAKMWDIGDSFGATAGVAGGTAIALGAATVVGGAALFGTVAALTTAPQIDKVGSSVPAVALAEPLYCYFIIQRSDCWIPVNYEKLYGRPLNMGGKVRDFVGFSTFGNFKLEGISGATPEEKLLINDLLQAGIYI